MIFFVGLLTYMALTSDVSAASSVNEVCLGGQDCGKNQLCALPEGYCRCLPDHIPWLGGCEPKRQHGQSCLNQIECTFSGDKNMQCKEGICECGNGKTWFDDLGKCSMPRHITLKKMDPKPKDDVDTVILDKKPNELFNSTKRLKEVNIGLFGPVSVVCGGLLVFALCVCFWSVQNPDLREDVRHTAEVEAERAKTRERIYSSQVRQKTVDNAKRIKEDPEKAVGQDNFGFDNFDAASHFTTQTEVCEASHEDYLKKHCQDIPIITRNGEDNIKMIFRHEKEPSWTPSTDEADKEVAGICFNNYKAFSTENPLVERMEKLVTPPPSTNRKATAKDDRNTNDSKESPSQCLEVRIVERVETDDCTSIDTSIPEEEVAQFQRGLDRQRKLLNLEEGEEEEEQHSSKSPSTPRSQATLDDLMEKEKPVFSIS